MCNLLQSLSPKFSSIVLPRLQSLSLASNGNVRAHIRQSDFGKEVPLFEIEATAVEPTFDRLYSYLFGLPADAHSSEELNRALPNAIFILNTDKVRVSSFELVVLRFSMDSAVRDKFIHGVGSVSTIEQIDVV